jgi:4-hydroxybutyrate CoA-transferase
MSTPSFSRSPDSARRASALEAVELVRSGHRVFVHGGAATPTALLDALVARAPELRGVELIHLHTEGEAKVARPEMAESFRVVSLFTGANLRSAFDADRIDYLPCLLSEIPRIFRSSRRSIEVALLHLSPPDRHGYCTLGVSVDVARAAVESADLLIAQINPRMPRVHGDGFVHLSELDAWVEVDVPLPEPGAGAHAPGSEAAAIGRLAAGLIEDGACLQAGIGAIPDAVLRELRGHRHLGIHSEMWSDGALALLECGAVDNSRKAVHPGKNVSSFVMGSRRLYDFVDDNPSVIQLGADYVNNPDVIARNPRVAAINSAVEIDLTGQICADSIGHRVISGAGGQLDFMRGASASEGGKAIIALTSRSGRGAPRIVASLRAGAGVVTPRAQVHHVVTEYGVADLFGRTLGERARALIGVAHPDDRENLSRAWHAVGSS